MSNETIILLTLVLSAAAALLALFLVILHFVGGRKAKSASDGVEEQLRLGRGETQTAAKDLRQEVGNKFKETNDSIFNTLDGLGKTQWNQLEAMSRGIKELHEGNQIKLDEIRKSSADGLDTSNKTISNTLTKLGSDQKEQLDGLTKQLHEFAESNRTALDRIRGTFDERIKELQEGNEKKLEEMRKTVDEKLHDTLEKRLGESFKLVSDRLDTVHKGLGEMQVLATGVGDLKRVLTNVKARGTWAEVQLGGLLEEILTNRQYQRNVQVKPDSNERVEFAIRFPGQNNDPDTGYWLPIDSKFPQEDYLRIQQAADAGDVDALQSAVEALARTIKHSAKDISSKYICPPHTTDFAIMFLSTEGLHAEVLRQPALVDELQRTHRIVIAGPTTLVAILSSLRMGFQTLAIEQRASEVWRILGATKTEFGKFGEVLDKVKKQLNTATKTIEDTGRRTRAIERHLRDVESMPELEADQLLALATSELLIADEVEMSEEIETNHDEENDEHPPTLFADDDEPF
jgi:DNA recombination protein RmuC